MTVETTLRAALSRALPVRAAGGELRLADGEHTVMQHDSVWMVQLAWRDAEAIEEDRPPVEHYITFGSKRFAMNVTQIEALLGAVRDVLTLMPRERALEFEYSGPSTWMPTAVLSKKSLATREQYFKALVDVLGISDLLLSEAERAALTSAEELDAMARECFPAKGGALEMYLGTASESFGSDRRGLTVAGACCAFSRGMTLYVGFMTYETAEREQVRDIKEQEVYVVEPSQRGDKERIRAFLQGLSDGLSALFRQRGDDESVQYAMPSELFDASLLSLKRARTRDDFFQAYCKRRKIDPAR